MGGCLTSTILHFNLLRELGNSDTRLLGGRPTGLCTRRPRFYIRSDDKSERFGSCRRRWHNIARAGYLAARGLPAHPPMPLVVGVLASDAVAFGKDPSSVSRRWRRRGRWSPTGSWHFDSGTRRPL